MNPTGRPGLSAGGLGLIRRGAGTNPPAGRVAGTVQAITVPRHGGPEVLALSTLDEPVPGPGELLVRVQAAGVNFVDTYQRTGVYPQPTPFTLGVEGAGEVTRSEHPDFAVGDHVAWKQALGSYAQYVTVPGAEAVPVPAGLADEDAAAVLLQGLTAQYLATSTYPVAAGDWVLVHAAAGGVGLLLTQIVVRRGGRVIATVGTDAKAELARGAGAEHVINYSREDFAAQVREITAGAGVRVVYDGVGRSTFDASLSCLGNRGLLALYGAASGQVPPFELQRLAAGGSLFVTRPSLGAYTTSRPELLARAQDVLGWAAAGELAVRIGHRYPLGQARQAHEDLEGRRTTGKLLLLP